MKRLLLLCALTAIAAVTATQTASAAGTPACGASPVASDSYLGTVGVDSTSMTASSFALPASGQYRLVSCGVWNNTSHGYVDTAYNSGDAWDWTGQQQGWPGIGPNWGELWVNGSAPDWGDYSDAHVYSTTVTASGSLGLLIYDGDSTGQIASWYGDNNGSLTVDVYKVNPMPTSADQCKKDGWKQYGVFKNQGDCVSYVATGGSNPPSGGKKHHVRDLKQKPSNSPGPKNGHDDGPTKGHQDH